MTQKSLSPLAWLLIGALAFIWGGSFLSTRTAMDEMGAFQVVAHRVTWAALALWLFVLIRKRPLPARTDIAPLILMGVLNAAIPFLLQAWAQRTIETGLAAIFNASTAIFGVVLAAIFLADERLTLRKGIGVLLGFFGVATAMGLDALRAFDIRSLSQLAMIGSTICYASAGIWARRRLSHLPPETVALGVMTTASLIALPLAFVMEGPPPLGLSPVGWVAVGYVSVIATAGAFLLLYRVIALAGASYTMLVTLLVAPIAVVLGAVVRAETLPPNAYAGFALLALGLIVLDGSALRFFRARVGRAPH